MYRIAICEDDPHIAEQNKAAACRALDQKGRVQGRDYDVDMFHTATPLIERLSEAPDAYQLLLLDIQLDGDNGVELARFLREHRVNASIIYITDHPGFALDSFPTYPLEYLLKPVDEERLSAALDWDWRQKHVRPKRPILRVGAAGCSVWTRSPIWKPPATRAPSIPKRSASSTPSHSPS